MRFGTQLKSSLIPNWYFYYIDYDQLKQRLKPAYTSAPNASHPNPSRKEWGDEDDQEFYSFLEEELLKVSEFQKVKSSEVVRRIKASEREVEQVIRRYEAARARPDDESVVLNAPSDEEFELLEEDVSDIIADVHDLAKFVQLNYTGFQKIIKKHDKLYASRQLKPLFAARLNANPFFKDNYDNFIVKLSRLYDDVRTRGSPVKGDSSAGGGQQNFVRNTTKYWVHADNITELKLIVLKHLPVLVFNPSKEFEAKDSAISSIYYDNTDTWELYKGRLQKTEGAEAIRLRWYGGMDTDTIFLERKTHREDWTGEKSVKARFALKEKNVNAFLRGDLTVSQAFEKMRKDGKKSEKEIAELEQLAREFQYRVIARKLVPVTRSFYNRTAFQLPGDARVRISLDTELTMTREDNLDGRRRAGDNWRRMDIGIDYPFSQLPAEDVERFPYAVLEVKLQTQAGQQAPEWIRELTASHLVEAVPKFSKFVHGTAILNPTRIRLLPFWMPQMHIDIRKPISHKFGIARPGQSTDMSTSGLLEEDTDDDEDDDNAELMDEDENENVRRLRAARDVLEQHEQEHLADFGGDGAGRGDGASNGNEMDEEERTAAKLSTADQDYPIYDSGSDDDDDEEDQDVAGDELAEAKRAGTRWRYAALLAKHHTFKVGHNLGRFLVALAPAARHTRIPAARAAMVGAGTAAVMGQAVTMEKRFRAPKGKKIHVPIRVEPKVNFANERTFLSWLEFSIIIGSIAATLLNFGDSVSLASAWAFTIVALASTFYSLFIFLWRVEKIRKRRAVSFHDRVGPTGLCVGLFAAVAVSFGLRVVNGSGHEGEDGAFLGG